MEVRKFMEYFGDQIKEDKKWLGYVAWIHIVVFRVITPQSGRLVPTFMMNILSPSSG
jgi:hypothetical protein